MPKHEEVFRKEGTFSRGFTFGLRRELVVRFTLTLMLLESHGYTYEAELICLRKQNSLFSNGPNVSSNS